MSIVASSHLCALGVALWLSAINVKFRDVKYTLQFLNQIWLYATPVVYPSLLIPEKWRFVQFINPTTGIVEGFRWSLLGSAPPTTSHIIISIRVILFIFITGLWYFHKEDKEFADIV